MSWTCTLARGNDKLDVTVLEDGTIKVDSGPVSQQNHMNAEAFMRNIAQAAGGKQERKHKQGFAGAMLHRLQHAMGSGHSHG